MQKIKPEGMVRIIRYAMIIVSILFITIGVLKQEHLEVLQKAVKICLECIGIG